MKTRKLAFSIGSILLCAFGLAAMQSQVPAADPPRPVTTEVTALATNFVELLVKKEFSSAVARFDSTMKAALSEQQLKDTWNGLERQFGSFQKQLGSRTFKQAGYEIVMVRCQFQRGAIDAKVVYNSQHLVAGLFFAPAEAKIAASTPPAYADSNRLQEVEVKLGSGDSALAGTLALPRSGTTPFRAVVLVHGSGPQDRNETVGGVQPFRDLAWGLASKGIAVLRYEKRTKSHPEQLKLSALTLKEETIDDAVTGVELLRGRDGIDPKRVYLLGHSLGGMAAPRIAQADTNIAGLIILAGSTRPLEDIVLDQTRYLVSLKSNSGDEKKQSISEIERQVEKIKRLTTNDPPGMMILGGPAGYWLDLRNHDPVAIAGGLPMPMLILQGGRDYQVTAADLDSWKRALSANPRVTFKEYPTLNHLFVTGRGKSTPAEYEQAGHVDAAVIKDIADWISSR